MRKELTTLERTIAKLDEQKRLTNAQFLQATDPAESLRLHNELREVASQLEGAEHRWCAVQEELAEIE